MIQEAENIIDSYMLPPTQDFVISKEKEADLQNFNQIPMFCFLMEKSMYFLMVNHVTLMVK